MSVSVNVHEVHDLPANLFIVYSHSGQSGDELPVGHCIHRSAFDYRAESHGLDPSHKDFHQQVVELVIGEALHDVDGVQGVHPESHSMSGQVHDLAALRKSVQITWKPGHLDTIRAAHPDPVGSLERHRAENRSITTKKVQL